MASYTIHYSDTESEKTENAAIKDVKNYLGTKQFNRIVKLLGGSEGVMPRNFALFGLMMQGVQGYPAEVMIKRYWQPQLPLDLE